MKMKIYDALFTCYCRYGNISLDLYNQADERHEHYCDKTVILQIDIYSLSLDFVKQMLGHGITNVLFRVCLID